MFRKLYFVRNLRIIEIVSSYYDLIKMLNYTRYRDEVDSGPILSPSNVSKISSLKSWVTLRDLEYYKTTNKKRGYFVIFSFEVR